MKKLEELRDLLLQEHEDFCFTIGMWLTPDYDTCGFAGCACGLWMHKHPEGTLAIDEFTQNLVHVSGAGGLDAAAAEFGITFDDARYLFSINSYPLGVTQADVAERITNFLETKHDDSDT